MAAETRSDIVTHGVGLWLQNDQGFYEWAKDSIQACVEDLDIEFYEVDEGTASVLSELEHQIEMFFDHLYEEQSDDLNPIFREFIVDSINAIDWAHLASYYEDEAREAVSSALQSA